jgi:hypothetical protein
VLAIFTRARAALADCLSEYGCRGYAREIVARPQ